MTRPLLILDLDETLVYAAEQPLERTLECRVGPYFVYRRPGVDVFLDTVSRWFEPAIWTSSSCDYAYAMLDTAFPNGPEWKFVWARERCTRRYHPELQAEYWLKDLQKIRRLGYALERTVMVDDSPEKLQRHYGNLVRVSPFMGDSADEELPLLTPFLEYLSGLENVRRVEKRNWRYYRS